MPTEVSLQELERASINVQYFAGQYKDFYAEIVKVLKLSKGVYRYRVVCRMILDEEVEVPPRTEDAAYYISEQIKQLQREYPEAFNQFARFLNRCRWTGFDNICRMVLGETPMQVKTIGRCSAL